MQNEKDIAFIFLFYNTLKYIFETVLWMLGPTNNTTLGCYWI